jgi:hypothetical protein
MTYEKAIKMGGTEWQRGDHHRVYFNRDAKKELYGLELEYYRTSGNISRAKRNGEIISNSRARKMLFSNTYFDVKKNEMCGMLE